MRVFVGLFIALTLQTCLAQQTTPAGLDSLTSNVLVWAASYKIPNTTSVSSWDAFNGQTLSTAGSAPTLLANQFNTVVPGVSFSGTQCLKSTSIGYPTSDYSVYVVALVPGNGVHVLTTQEESSTVIFSLVLSRNSTTMELGFYANGGLLASTSAEAANYLVGDPMIFWFTQSGSSSLIGFELQSNAHGSNTPSFSATVTTAVGCNINGDYLTGVIGEVIITKSGGNTAVHNIILNNLAARYGAAIPTEIYTGMSEQISCNEDVSGIGTESDGNVLSGNSVQLTISRQSALPVGDYIMFGRAPDDGDLFAFPYKVNFSRFSREWFVSVSIQNVTVGTNATADVTFDISSVKEALSGQGVTYFLLYQPSSTISYETISEAGVLSGDGNSVTFSGATLYTGYLTIGSSAAPPAAPLTPHSGPVDEPAAEPGAPTSEPTYAYPSPGILRRSSAVGTTVSVVSILVLAAGLLF